MDFTEILLNNLHGMNEERARANKLINAKIVKLLNKEIENAINGKIRFEETLSPELYDGQIIALQRLRKRFETT